MKSKKTVRKNIKKKKYKFTPPEWWECAWRRVGCGKMTCPICGKIKQRELFHRINGEDPYDLETVLEDLGNDFKDLLKMVEEDAKVIVKRFEMSQEEIEEEIERERSETYKKVFHWRKGVFHIISNLEVNRSSWMETESVQDLIWYSNTFLSKTFRQSINREDLQKGEKEAKFDYDYTKYVLKECAKILEKSIRHLSENINFLSKDLEKSETELKEIKTEVFKI